MMIKIVPHNKEWRNEFGELASQIRTALGDNICIHHIGSTAINAMPAKDVIDIQISVAKLDDVRIGDFEAAGFEFISSRFDHMPAGAAIPSIELRKLFFRSTGRTANLHVRQQGHFNQRYAVLCRDFLRQDAVACAAYAKLKCAAAGQAKGDKETYYRIKDPVFDIIMAAANLWAQSAQWDIPPPD